MPKAVTHNDCPLCRKKFTAKRHSLLRRIPTQKRIAPSYSSWNWMSNRTNRIKPSKPRVENEDIIVTICGKCKSSIKSGHTERLEKWCVKNHLILSHHTVYYFDTDKVVQERIHPKKYRKPAGRGNYWFYGRGSKKFTWVDQHNKTVKVITNPEVLREEQKKWTDEELRQFNKMLGRETAERHAEHAEFKRQLAEEFSTPLRDWLEK